MTLSASLLRTKVYIQRQQYVQDSAGDPIQDPVSGELRFEWVTYRTVMANVAYLSAKEFIAAGAKMSEASGRITLRWFADFNASDRFVKVSDGTIFDPKGRLPDLDSGREYMTVPFGEGAIEGA